MTWLAAILLVVVAACLTLAVIHAHVWLRHGAAGANAAFAVLAASVAGMAFAEMRMAHADTIDAFGRMLWWYHLPVWSALVAIVWFVRLFLGVGRPWLGWTAIGLRTLALVINMFSTPAINFREITALDKVAVLGEAATVVRGIPDPWLAIAQLSLVVLIAFVADAAIELWRRGDRRRAVTIGGSLTLFVTAGTVMAFLAYWGIARLPVLATLFFLPIVLAMGFELSLELIRAVRLAAELTTRTAELQGSEEKLALAADAASAGLWSVDGASRMLWATPRALAMFGLAPSRAHCIDDMWASIHPDDRERVRDSFEDARRSGCRTSVEYRVVAADGGTRWYASLGRARAGPDGAPPGLTGVTIDITERKKVEDEAARQRVELEHLSRVASLSEMSGVLAHELNQPLAIIMSNAEAAQRLLSQPAPDLDELRAILGDIVAADGRAGGVIERLRGLLERRAPDPRPLSVNDLVRAVLQFMRGDLIRRGVTMDLALAEPMPNVDADPIPIEQVLINIVTNAADAMAGNDPGDRRLAIKTGVESGEIHVRIADVGSGLPVPPERIFAPFYTTKATGLGLGLAISRSIVAAHGGRLWAQTNDARGATLHLCLPIAEPGT